ncbi:unnamed protein product, partial [Cochlearia groenlandica]
GSKRRVQGSLKECKRGEVKQPAVQTACPNAGEKESKQARGCELQQSSNRWIETVGSNRGA